MKIETAKAIVDVAEEMGLDITIREDYSGRGMYGKTTAGLIASSDNSLLKCVALAAARIQETEACFAKQAVKSGFPEPAITLDDFIADLSFRRDSMGHDLIVY